MTTIPDEQRCKELMMKREPWRPYVPHVSVRLTTFPRCTRRASRDGYCWQHARGKQP